MKNAISILNNSIFKVKESLKKLHKIADNNMYVQSVIDNENNKIKEYELAIYILKKTIENCNNCSFYNKGYCEVMNFKVSINAKWCKIFKLKL